MDENIARGKNTLIGIIAAVLGISLLSTIVTIITNGFSGFATDIIRFGLSCLLCFFLYKGQTWAKWVMVVLYLLAGVLGLIGALSIIVSFVLGITSLALGIIYGGSAILLLTSKDIKAFLAYQKGA